MDIKSENDKFFSASEVAMAAVGLALLPGAFLVDLFPMRTSSSQKTFPKGSYNVHSHSQIRPGMVSRSRFQEVREDSEEEF